VDRELTTDGAGQPVGPTTPEEGTDMTEQTPDITTAAGQRAREAELIAAGTDKYSARAKALAEAGRARADKNR
jgi:hypothetical protein